MSLLVMGMCNFIYVLNCVKMKSIMMQLVSIDANCNRKMQLNGTHAWCNVLDTCWIVGSTVSESDEFASTSTVYQFACLHYTPYRLLCYLIWLETFYEWIVSFRSSSLKLAHSFHPKHNISIKCESVKIVRKFQVYMQNVAMLHCISSVVQCKIVDCVWFRLRMQLQLQLQQTECSIHYKLSSSM